MIEIVKIKTHEGSQAREQVNQQTVDEYAEAILDGAEFPAVILFFDGVSYWLADGFHRVLAHQKAGKESIFKEVRLGGQRDAILYSFGANDAHGLRRSNADKRKVVNTMLADIEWAGWSDRQIAKQCKVHHELVGTCRKNITGGTATVSLSQPINNDLAKRKFTTSTGKTAEHKVKQLTSCKESEGKRPVEPCVAAHCDDQIEACQYDELDCEPSQEEVDEARKWETEQNDYLKEILSREGEPLAAALIDVSKFREAARIATERFNGVQNEKNALIRQIKSLQLKLRKAEEKLKAAGLL